MTGDIRKLQDIYTRHLKSAAMPLPRIIHVETRSKCNGLCKFCPAAATTDMREDIRMELGLIKKIINELGMLDYHNRLSFYNNNEPFLDERIFEIIRMARERLPRAYLELKSNGIALNIDKICQIFNCGLDMLYINYHSANADTVNNIQRIISDLNNSANTSPLLIGTVYHIKS